MLKDEPNKKNLQQEGAKATSAAIQRTSCAGSWAEIPRSPMHRGSTTGQREIGCSIRRIFIVSRKKNPMRNGEEDVKRDHKREKEEEGNSVISSNCGAQRSR